MMTCRDVIEMVSRALDGPISFRQWLGMRSHTLYCSPCRRCRRQLLRVDAACRAHFAAGPPEGEQLSAFARGRIAAALGRAADE